MMENLRRRTGSFGASLKIEPEPAVVGGRTGLNGMDTAMAMATSTTTHGHEPSSPSKRRPPLSPTKRAGYRGVAGMAQSPKTRLSGACPLSPIGQGSPRANLNRVQSPTCSGRMVGEAWTPTKTPTKKRGARRKMWDENSSENSENNSENNNSESGADQPRQHGQQQQPHVVPVSGSKARVAVGKAEAHTRPRPAAMGPTAAAAMSVHEESTEEARAANSGRGRTLSEVTSDGSSSSGTSNSSTTSDSTSRSDASSAANSTAQHTSNSTSESGGAKPEQSVRLRSRLEHLPPNLRAPVEDMILELYGAGPHKRSTLVKEMLRSNNDQHWISRLRKMSRMTRVPAADAAMGVYLVAMEYWSDQWTLNRKSMPRVLRCERVGLEGARHALYGGDEELCEICAVYAIESLVDRVTSTPHQERSISGGLHRWDAGACDVMMLYYLVDRPRTCELLSSYGAAKRTSDEEAHDEEGDGKSSLAGVRDRAEEISGSPNKDPLNDSAFDTVQTSLALSFKALTTLCPEHGSVQERQHKKAQFIRDHQDGSPSKKTKAKGKGKGRGKGKGARETPEKKVKTMERNILVSEFTGPGSTPHPTLPRRPSNQQPPTANHRPPTTDPNLQPLPQYGYEMPLMSALHVMARMMDSHAEGTEGLWADGQLDVGLVFKVFEYCIKLELQAHEALLGEGTSAGAGAGAGAGTPGKPVEVSPFLEHSVELLEVFVRRASDLVLATDLSLEADSNASSTATSTTTSSSSSPTYASATPAEPHLPASVELHGRLKSVDEEESSRGSIRTRGTGKARGKGKWRVKHEGEAISITKAFPFAPHPTLLSSISDALRLADRCRQEQLQASVR